jgi:mRNA-degrading endonuclease toxin of MazEF toxin-antitoxin module
MDATSSATAAALDPKPEPGSHPGSYLDLDLDLEPDLELELEPEPEPDALATALAVARAAAYAARRSDVRRNVRLHRQRLRAKGLRPVQFWLPDLRLAEAQREAHRQARAVAWTAPSLVTPRSPKTENALQRGELRRLSISLSHGRSGPVLRTRADLEAAPIVAIVLDDAFAGLPTTLVCPLTRALCPAPLLRIAVAPTPDNGLSESHQLMLDALTSLPRAQLGGCIGRLSNDDQKRLNHGLLVVSGLAR